MNPHTGNILHRGALVKIPRHRKLQSRSKLLSVKRAAALRTGPPLRVRLSPHVCLGFGRVRAFAHCILGFSPSLGQLEGNS